MAQRFLGCDRDQAFLLPPRLDDWLPADHVVWLVIAVVEEMDPMPSTSPIERTGMAGRRTIRR
jgi:hypothetical protein